MKTYNFNKKDTLIAFFASLCLFLSAIEYVIPKPLPFMRFGLANMPILISLYVLKPKQVLSLVFLKVIGQGLLTGTIFSYIFIFSLSGSLASAIMMFSVYKLGKEYIGPVGIGLAGAIANAFMQILLSILFLFGESTQYVAPILILNACSTGLLLGIFTAQFMQNSVWLEKIKTDTQETGVVNE